MISDVYEKLTVKKTSGVISKILCGVIAIDRSNYESCCMLPRKKIAHGRGKMERINTTTHGVTMILRANCHVAVINCYAFLLK